MSYKPLRDLILLKLDEAKETLPGSLIVVPNADKPNTGTIVATGPGIRDKNGILQELAVSPKDRVMIVQGAGKEIKVDGEQLLIVHESDIIVIFE